MAEKTKSLEQLVAELSLELRAEVEEFVRNLIKQKEHRGSRPLKLDWRGALRDLRDQYTSVELQHEIRDMWDGEEPSV